jgi:hypothetical protein
MRISALVYFPGKNTPPAIPNQEWNWKNSCYGLTDNPTVKIFDRRLEAPLRLVLAMTPVFRRGFPGAKTFFGHSLPVVALPVCQGPQSLGQQDQIPYPSLPRTCDFVVPLGLEESNHPTTIKIEAFPFLRDQKKIYPNLY